MCKDKDSCISLIDKNEIPMKFGVSNSYGISKLKKEADQKGQPPPV